MAGAGDFIRIGRQLRALRRRKGLRQRDVAAIARVAQSTVSLVERGHGDRVTPRLLESIAATVDARLDLTIRWRAGDLDRLMDADHADIAAAVAALLRRDGWDPRTEVTFAIGREQGSIDIIAWHAPTRTLLVIEVKTEIVSAERMLRTLDVKVRLAPTVARRFGWDPAVVGRLIVVAESSTNRRRAASLRPLLGPAEVSDSRTLRRWLRRPMGTVDGLWLWSTPGGRKGRRAVGGAHRVRATTSPPRREPVDARS